MLDTMLIVMVICFVLSFIFQVMVNDNIFWFFLFIISGILLLILSFGLLLIEHFMGS